ncbi:MAG: hypothetical protein IAE67_04100 [Candidatus Competibacteraceae bacterium]|nr:hypothetical protein [Candidatus Competibacteraceae bacterium]
MKKQFVFAIVLSCSLLLAAGCGKKASDNTTSDNSSTTTSENVNKFTTEEGNFKIAFPGEPTISNEKVPTEVGDIDMHMYMYEKGYDEAYMVAFSDYPKELVDAGDKGEMLQGSKEGVVSNISAKLEDEKKIEIDGHPGLFFKAKGPQFATVYKLFMVNNRLYQVGILRASDYPSDADTKSFLDSFELIRK